MIKRVENELKRRFEEAHKNGEFFINITLKSNGKTVQITEDRNLWSRSIRPYYTLSYVELNDYGYVKSATYIDSVDSLTEVAQLIVEESEVG